jgi:sugar/nucleoside kinase (ribokinase family)
MDRLPRFDITVAGELNLDLILYGLPEDLPTEREFLADGLSVTLGSSSAIFAHNLAVIGSRVGFVSRLGDDPLGRIALDRLAATGVDVSKCCKVENSTQTGLTVVLPHATSRRILTYPGTMFEMCFEDLDLGYLTDAKHFHLSSFFLHRALRPRLVELFRGMKAAGLSTSLDTNDDPEDLWGHDVWDVLKYVDVFLPNEREARKVSGVDDLEGAMAILADRVPVVAVKLGPAGALGQRGGERLQSPSPATGVESVDPVGAGDSFDAGFLHQYVRGGNLATCLAYGNLAGAFSTTRPGGTEAFRNRQNFEQFFRRHWTENAGNAAGITPTSVRTNP